MPNETHNHYHINLLPQNDFAWLCIAFASIMISIWGFSSWVDVAKAQAEKAKYEAQAHLTK